MYTFDSVHGWTNFWSDSGVHKDWENCEKKFTYHKLKHEKHRQGLQSALFIAFNSWFRFSSLYTITSLSSTAGSWTNNNKSKSGPVAEAWSAALLQRRRGAVGLRGSVREAGRGAESNSTIMLSLFP